MLALAALALPPRGAGAVEPLYAAVHHPISSSSLNAQRRFDEGLTLLYAFSRLAARRAFQHAAAADPSSAIAYWGIAMSYGGNINEPPDVAGERLSVAAIRRALALSRNASPEERALIRAAATRFSNAANPNFAVLDSAYQAAMRGVAHAYPEDPDAGTLYAESGMNLRPWDLYAVDGTPRPGTAEICTTLETVLKNAPGHIGANHLYLHAVEASLHPERALQAAGVLASYNYAPAASHLTHMPSHTLARSGYFREAGGSNVLATAEDRMYLSGAGRGDLEQTAYYTHNLMFLAYTDSMAGNAGRAASLSSKLRALEIHATPLFVDVRFARWKSILATPQPKPDALEPLRLLFWRYARGMALAGTGDVDGAIRERGAMNAVAAGVHIPGRYGFFNSAESLSRLADDVLGARIAERQHNTAAALAKLRDAIAVQDGLLYIEPPDWFFPVRESLGGLLLRTGKPAEAARVFRADLAHNAENPRSLFGLSKALAATGDASGAARVAERFHKTWKDATVTLTVGQL